MPTDVESHAIAHQYPFASADILCSSKTIAQALIEGGWNVKPDNDEEKSDQDSEDQVNKMVRDSLNETNVSGVSRPILWLKLINSGCRTKKIRRKPLSKSSTSKRTLRVNPPSRS